MNVLLDTHVWIWSQECPERLGERARAVLDDAETRILLSPISTLEIARLVARGDVQLRGKVRDWVRRSRRHLLAEVASLTDDIAIASYDLPTFHKDPCDRMLVATARVLRCALMTADVRVLASRYCGTLNALL